MGRRAVTTQKYHTAGIVRDDDIIQSTQEETQQQQDLLAVQINNHDRDETTETTQLTARQGRMARKRQRRRKNRKKHNEDETDTSLWRDPPGPGATLLVDEARDGRMARKSRVRRSRKKKEGSGETKDEEEDTALGGEDSIVDHQGRHVAMVVDDEGDVPSSNDDNDEEMEDDTLFVDEDDDLPGAFRMRGLNSAGDDENTDEGTTIAAPIEGNLEGGGGLEDQSMVVVPQADLVEERTIVEGSLFDGEKPLRNQRRKYLFMLGITTVVTALIGTSLGLQFGNNTPNANDEPELFASNSPTMSPSQSSQPSAAPSDSNAPSYQPTASRYGLLSDLVGLDDDSSIYFDNNSTAADDVPYETAISFILSDDSLFDSAYNIDKGNSITPQSKGGRKIIQRYAMSVLFACLDRISTTLYGLSECDWEGVSSCNDEDEVLSFSTTEYYVGVNNVYVPTYVPVPTELGLLTSLTSFWLRQNWRGTIPTEIGRLTSLIGFGFISNLLTGQIPTEIGNLSLLTELRLLNNLFSGSIPSELGSLTMLKWVEISKNQLTGSIPTELGALTATTNLILDKNLLSGTIPTELGRLNLMQILNLNENQLSGTVPTEFQFLVDNLTTMKVNMNQLTGNLDPILCPDYSSEEAEQDIFYYNRWSDFWSDCFESSFNNHTNEAEIQCSCCGGCCPYNATHRCDCALKVGRHMSCWLP